MFDEVIVFPNGMTIAACDGEPVLRYPSVEALLVAHKIDSHQLVPIEDEA
ncbi:MAG: hypothetical protein NVS3B20_12620 [Polyangiales bacterium]